MYVEYAGVKGITPISYETWLMNIRGQDGQDGLTPYIGANASWWIGDVDTGISATGAQGIQGDKGDQGVGIFKVEYNNGYLVFYFTDGTTQMVKSLFGNW